MPTPLLLHNSFDEKRLHELRQEFDGATPCKHIVLDDLVSPGLDKVLDEFPSFEWAGWHRFKDNYQAEKVTFSDLDSMPGPTLSRVFWELNGPSFLEFLVKVTGIESLLSDPFLKGGGLHCSGPGGTLTPHTDFHRHHELKLSRRLNALIYLNRDWGEADGGALQLFSDPEATVVAKEIQPSFGRCVVFLTDHTSVHGFTQPIASGRFRRSLATYYYTSEEADIFSGDLTTYWRQHETDRSIRDRVGMGAYRTLLRGSQALSIAAHKANPNLRGSGRVEEVRE